METLKFLMVSTHYPPFHIGGDAVMVDYLSRQLAREGHEVHVLYNPTVFRILRGGLPGQEKGAWDQPPTRHEYNPALKRMSTLLAHTVGWWKGAEAEFKRLVKDIRPDVVHWHNTKGFVGRPLGSSGSTLLYTAHDYYAVCPKSNLIRPDGAICLKPRNCQICLIRNRKVPQMWRIGGGRVLRMPPDMRVICPSEFVARRLQTDGIRVARVIRNFVPDPSGFPARRPDGVTITYVGILERHKGVKTLIEAFSRSRDRHGFRLIVVGEGSQKEELRTMVANHGIGDRVVVTGYLPDSCLREVLEKTTMAVVPSEWYENAPLAVLEAFSHGIPVMGSDLGGLPEILGLESGSITYRAGDPAALTEAMVMAWENREGLRKAGSKAREVYMKRFSPEAHLRQYIDMIRECART